MFWKRDRTVRVEVTTQINIVRPLAGPPLPHRASTMPNQAKGIDADLVFKFGTFLIGVLHAMLIV